jgi:hypothetical protein
VSHEKCSVQNTMFGFTLILNPNLYSGSCSTVWPNRTPNIMIGSGSNIVRDVRNRTAASLTCRLLVVVNRHLVKETRKNICIKTRPRLACPRLLPCPLLRSLLPLVFRGVTWWSNGVCGVPSQTPSQPRLACYGHSQWRDVHVV